MYCEFITDFCHVLCFLSEGILKLVLYYAFAFFWFFALLGSFVLLSTHDHYRIILSADLHWFFWFWKTACQNSDMVWREPLGNIFHMGGKMSCGWSIHVTFSLAKLVWLYSINTKNQIQSQTIKHCIIQAIAQIIKHCIIQTIVLMIHSIKQTEIQALAFYSNWTNLTCLVFALFQVSSTASLPFVVELKIHYDYWELPNP